MPVTFKQLVDRVLEEIESSDPDCNVDPERIVRATLAGLGMCVNSVTGEVYDPAPKPVINYPNNQNGVRWSGSGRRRSGGRR